MEPPELLFMGTTQKDARRFQEKGILSKDRSYVHLSLERAVAESRSGHLVMPCVLEVLAAKAHAAGIAFFPRGEVVLSNEIPAEFVGEATPLSGQPAQAAPARAQSAPAQSQSAPAQSQPAAKGQMNYGRRPRRATGRR